MMWLVVLSVDGDIPFEATLAQLLSRMATFTMEESVVFHPIPLHKGQGDIFTSLVFLQSKVQHPNIFSLL